MDPACSCTQQRLSFLCDLSSGSRPYYQDQAHLEIWRRELKTIAADSPLGVPFVPPGPQFVCYQCGFVAGSAQQLSSHVGRQHKADDA
eukprot:1717353-Pyramimonas_sp.AAC.1